MKPYDNAFLDELSPQQRAQLEQARNETSQDQTLEARQLEEQAQAPTKSKAWDTPERDFQNRLANAGAREFEIAMLEDQASNRLETHLNLQAKAKYKSSEEQPKKEEIKEQQLPEGIELVKCVESQDRWHKMVEKEIEKNGLTQSQEIWLEMRDKEIAEIERDEAINEEIILEKQANITWMDDEIERMKREGTLSKDAEFDTVEIETFFLESQAELEYKELKNLGGSWPVPEQVAENVDIQENEEIEQDQSIIGDGWASPEQIAENVKAQQEFAGAEDAPNFRDELTTQSREALERYEVKQEKEPMDISIGSEISQSQGEGQRLKAE